MILLFVGGAHGVGKSTLCERLSGLIGATHVVASRFLKEDDTRLDDKSVTNVQDNQDRIIKGIHDLTPKPNTVLLDGHFCVIGVSEEIVPIAEDAFKALKPAGLLLLDDTAENALARLRKRGEEGLEVSQIKLLMECERARAGHLSSYLGVPLMIWNYHMGLTVAAEFLESCVRRASRSNSPGH